MKIAIIGGGASGVACALRIKQNNPKIEVHLFEKSPRLLKKVSVSGAGRCNLSNVNITIDKYANPSFIKQIMELGYLDELSRFIQSLGLMIRTDSEGRIYPRSNQAASIVELLNKELFYRQIKIKCQTEITKVKHLASNKYQLNDFDDEFDSVVIAIGSNAFLSNTLEHYKLLTDLELTLSPIRAGLVGFKVLENVTELAGVRCQAAVSFGQRRSIGEVIFKNDGISGICVMDLSIYFNRQTPSLTIDLFAELSYDELNSFIDNRLKNDRNLKLYNVFIGALDSKIINYINRDFANMFVSQLDNTERLVYLKRFKEFQLTILDTYDFMHAQVAVGGIVSDEFTAFCLKKYPSVYACGEVLDEAGVCGGYNLWFAFTTGIIVADRISRCSNES